MPRSGLGIGTRSRLQWTAVFLLITCALAGDAQVVTAQTPSPSASAGNASLAEGSDLLAKARRALESGDARNATVRAQAALTIFRGLPTDDPRVVFGVGNAYFLLAMAAAADQRDVKALEYFEAALERYNALKGAERNRLALLNKMWQLLLRMERTDDAIAVLREVAVKGAALGESHAMQARARDNLGALLMQSDRAPEAIREFQQAVALSSDEGSGASDQAKYLYDLAMAEIHLQRNEAIGHFRQALSVLGSARGTEGQHAEILLDYSIALRKRSQIDEARQELLRATELVKGHPELATLRAKLLGALASDTYDRPGGEDEAIRMYREILAQRSDDPELRDAQRVARINVSNHLVHTGRIDEAIAMYREQLSNLTDAESRTADARLLRWNLGVVLMKKGLREEAQQHLIEALKLTWESLAKDLSGMTRMQRNTAINALVADVAPILSLALSEPGGDAASAYETVLLTKALYSEALRNDALALRMTADAETRAKYWRYLELRRQVSRRAIADKTRTGETDRAELESLAKEMQDLESDLKQSPDMLTQQARLPAIRPKTVLAKLRPGERLLEYVIYPSIELASGKAQAERYAAFVIDGTTQRITVVDLGEAATINGLIATYQELERTQVDPVKPAFNEAELAARARAVRRAILDPVLPKPQAMQRIYVAPADMIGLLPFEALPTDPASAKPSYLVEQLEIVYVTTGRDLTRFGALPTQNPSREFWLVGDPAYDATAAQRLAQVREPEPVRRPRSGTQISLVGARHMAANTASDAHEIPNQWPRLEGTRAVVTAAAAVARKVGLVPRILVDAAASEDRVADMHSPRAVMFATHGYFLQNIPTFSLHYSSTDGGTLNPDLYEAVDPLQRSMLVLAGANRRLDLKQWYQIGDARLTLSQARQRGLSGTQLELYQRELGDGLLTAYEVMGLDLSETELVMLAGCETGLGVAATGVAATGTNIPGFRQPTGEGVAGLRQAFLIAGAHSLVMSMWEVAVDQTVEQVQDFLDSWLSRGHRRYTAFRQSQLTGLANARQRLGTSHPFWWAGFIYFGDPGDRAK